MMALCVGDVVDNMHPFTAPNVCADQRREMAPIADRRVNASTQTMEMCTTYAPRTPGSSPQRLRIAPLDVAAGSQSPEGQSSVKKARSRAAIFLSITRDATEKGVRSSIILINSDSASSSATCLSMFESSTRST